MDALNHFGSLSWGTSRANSYLKLEWNARLKAVSVKFVISSFVNFRLMISLKDLTTCYLITSSSCHSTVSVYFRQHFINETDILITVRAITRHSDVNFIMVRQCPVFSANSLNTFQTNARHSP